MKKKTLKLGIFLLSFLFIIACSSDDDISSGVGNEPEVINNPDQNIDEFIWQGLNTWYLYKSSVSDLANDRFNTQQELFQFLQRFSSPEETFDGLKSRRTITANNQVFDEDPFSFIIPDYTVFEQSQAGVSTSNGMEFGLIRINNTNIVLGYVRLVLPNTDAESDGLERGMYFDAVDGVKLTANTDFNAVFSPDTYTINIVTFNGTTVTETGQTISLTKTQYTENPIFSAKTLDYQGQKIGYLMYNDFIFNFDEQLNDAFAQLKADGITDLVLDLRYNPGGRVSSAVILASLITGQFTDEIIIKQNWNAELQAAFSAQNPEDLINRFVNVTLDNSPLNTLGLAKVYVLTSRRSASASELIINGLDPYIDVIQIGETTSGKYQASATLYDSDNFLRNGQNFDENHTYAIQPLIFKSSNANDVTDYAAGLFPDILYSELERVFTGQNIGQIGEVDEPHLKVALDFITMGTTAVSSSNKGGIQNKKIYWEPDSMHPYYQKMYIDINRHSTTLKNILK